MLFPKLSKMVLLKKDCFFFVLVYIFELVKGQQQFSYKTTGSPQIRDKTCLLKPDRGPCRSGITMYYFDPEEKNCTTFEWGGCQGNGNRFDSYSRCKEVCYSPKPNIKERPRYCFLTYDYGWCFGAEPVFYYDYRWKVCKKGIYSGCGGNKNRFKSFEQCEEICRFGNDALSGKYNKDGIKKYLIINPVDATTRRAVNTTTTTPRNQAKVFINRDEDDVYN